MRRHIAVDDCGRILNPLLVRGQQHGGIAQGAAQALFEWVQYDEDGNPLTTNLMDYTIPAASELSSFEASNTETDSPRNPLGAKGIGESGTIGSTPAIQNAVVDALSHLGHHAHRHAVLAGAGVASHSGSTTRPAGLGPVVPTSGRPSPAGGLGPAAGSSWSFPHDHRGRRPSGAARRRLVVSARWPVSALLA